MSDKNVIDVERIMKMLPHRYPMLMIDRIISAEGDERAVAVKNVTINEPVFMGHFPGKPVFPGVLLVEAMAQTAGALVVNAYGDGFAGKLVYFMAIDDAKCRRPVVPGDRVEIHVQKLQGRRNVWKFRGEAKVDGALCAEATVT